MICLSCLAVWLFASALISFIIVCLVLFMTSKPYPDLVRSKKEKYFPTSSEKGKSEVLFPSIDDNYSVSLSVIVPAYNEELRLPPMLDECLSFLEERKKNNKDFSYEVIVVSDGSSDKTVEVATKYTDKFTSDVVRVLALQPNRGKGGAVQMGVQSARGALILFADADGATKFSDLVKLEESLQKIIKSDYLLSSDVDEASCKEGLICGSRAHLEQDAIATRSLFRTFLMHGFHLLVYTLAVRTVRDTQCGFKLFTRQTARSVFSSLHVQRWAFDVELLYIAEALKIPIDEVAVNWTEIEGSKIIPVLSWLQMGKDLLLIYLRYAIGAWKIKTKKL